LGIPVENARDGFSGFGAPLSGDGASFVDAGRPYTATHSSHAPYAALDYS